MGSASSPKECKLPLDDIVDDQLFLRTFFFSMLVPVVFSILLFVLTFAIFLVSSAAFVSCHSGAADCPCNANLGSQTTSQRPTLSVPCISHAHLRAKRATFRAFSADGGGGTKAACATNCRSFPRASSRFDAWERVRCEHNHSVTRTETSRRHPQSQ